MIGPQSFYLMNMFSLSMSNLHLPGTFGELINDTAE